LTGRYNATPDTIREATYYDTPNKELAANFWILRKRQELPAPVYDWMIKFRTPDCLIAKNADMSVTPTARNVLRKFEEDVWYNEWSEFSNSARIDFSTTRTINTFKEALAMFPGLSNVPIPDSSPLVIPFNFTFIDQTFLGVRARLGNDDTDIEVSRVTRNGILELVELAFKVPATNQAAVQWFKQVQTTGIADSIVLPVVTSKTKIAFTAPAQDCTWNPWGSYSNCSVTCGGGVQVRSRTQIQATIGGQPCQGNSTESMACNTQACVADCSWTAWGPPSPCSKTCGGGTANRTRTFIPPLGNGVPCNPKDGFELITCNTESCPEAIVSGSKSPFQWWWWLVIGGGILLLIIIVVIIVCCCKKKGVETV
jgi:hypothetical protein